MGFLFLSRELHWSSAHRFRNRLSLVQPGNNTSVASSDLGRGVVASGTELAVDTQQRHRDR
jgi:hypothetical protein